MCYMNAPFLLRECRSSPPRMPGSCSTKTTVLHECPGLLHECPGLDITERRIDVKFGTSEILQLQIFRHRLLRHKISSEIDVLHVHVPLTLRAGWQKVVHRVAE